MTSDTMRTYAFIKNTSRQKKTFVADMARPRLKPIREWDTPFPFTLVMCHFH